MKNLLITALFLVFTSIVSAQQDTIFKFTGEVIPCSIKEIGEDRVKYVLPEKSNEIVFSTDFKAIRKIVLKNGEILFVTPEMENAGNYESQKNRAIKINFLSPVFGFFELGYEHSLKPGRSIEASASLVAPMFNQGDNEKARGANFRIGMKFLKSPDFYLRGMRYSHILKGSYIRTDLLMSFLNHENTNEFDFFGNTTPENYATQSFGFSINIGKQVVFDDSFLIDYFAGVGYGVIIESGEGGSFSVDSRKGWIQGGSELPLNISVGLRIGFLL